MLRRFLLATLAAATLAGGLVLSVASPAPAHALSAPKSYAEGSCVGEMCAPPNGALPGLNPPRLPFAEPAVACDGTEPEFSYPEGNPQISRADATSPALRRMYSWYRDPKTDAPVKWGAHCDVMWSTVVGAPTPTIVMPDVITANATVPARVVLNDRAVNVGEALPLPSVTVPRKAPEAPYTVLPIAKLSDIRWVNTENCIATPLPNANTIASVKVLRPIDPRTTACLSIETTWDVAATARAADGTVAPVVDVIGTQGQRCGDACTMTNRTTQSGATTLIAEEGIAAASAEPNEATLAPSGCRNNSCAKPNLTLGKSASKTTVTAGGSTEISSGFLESTSRDGILATVAIGLGLGLLVGWFRFHRT